MPKKKGPVKAKLTLKHSTHASTRASKKKEKQVESNEEEEERINENIVVVVNHKKKMVRNNKMNEQITNKVVGKVNTLDPNEPNMKKTFQYPNSKQQINGENSNTSSMDNSESDTESNLEQSISKHSPKQESKAIINTKGCIDWELEQFVRSSIFPCYKFVTSDDEMNYSMEKQSLSQIILKGINCNGTQEQVVWNELQTNVIQILKICRSNTTAAIKTGFKGELK